MKTVDVINPQTNEDWIEEFRQITQKYAKRKKPEKTEAEIQDFLDRWYEPDIEIAPEKEYVVNEAIKILEQRYPIEAFESCYPIDYEEREKNYHMPYNSNRTPLTLTIPCDVKCYSMGRAVKSEKENIDLGGYAHDFSNMDRFFAKEIHDRGYNLVAMPWFSETTDLHFLNGFIIQNDDDSDWNAQYMVDHDYSCDIIEWRSKKFTFIHKLVAFNHWADKTAQCLEWMADLLNIITLE